LWFLKFCLDLIPKKEGRMMNVTFLGKKLTLEGVQPKVGEKAPDFHLFNLDEKEVSLSDLLTKPTLISVVPNIDTKICSIQTKKFYQELGAVEGIHLVTISDNTREEQAGWCATEGVEMEFLHDTDRTFGKAYGLFIPKFGHLARATFVIDTDGTIVYEEIVPKIGQEPEYQPAIKALEELKK
jgi:thiol peroxidase